MEQTNVDSGIKATGRLKIEVFAEDGSLRHSEVNNLVVTVGKNFIAARMKDATVAAMSHMAIGDGSSATPGTATAAALADTALGNELARVALGSTTVTGNEVQYSATFGPNVPVSAAQIVEAGIFNSAAGGTMLARTTFAVVNKTATDTMTITWTVTVS